MFIDDKLPLFIKRRKFVSVPAVMAAAQFQFADAVESRANAAFDKETFWANQSVIVSGNGFHVHVISQYRSQKGGGEATLS